MTTGFRAMLAERRLKAGTSVFEFDAPGIGHILKSCGAEFMFLDMEHSGFGIDTLKRMLRYCEAADLPALVRPPSKAVHHIARALDAGASGLMLPMVADADEARAIVRAMKYEPGGARGVALGIAHDRYRPGPVTDKLNAANEGTAMVALIETADGVRNVDEIAAVEGLDGLWVGHFDLSCSLGIPGQFDHPDFVAANDKVIAAAKAHGKALGRLVNSADEGASWFARGFDLICYSGDLWLLQEALGSGLTALRESCGEGAAG